MVRAERNQPDIYFGRPGALVQLPWPRGDVDSPFDRLTHDFVTGAGQHQVAQLLGGSRLYTVNWDALHVDNYRKIEQYWLGAMGVGPWCIIDPSRPNLLLPNQAAATSVWNTAKDFSTASIPSNGEPLSNEVATHIHRVGAPRSLRWYFAAQPPTLPTLQFTPPYRGWFGIPCVPGLPYTFSAWVKPDGVVDSSITASIKINWLTTANTNATVAESTSADTVITGWQRISVTATAPSNAAYINPKFLCLNATITAGSSLYIDELLLEQDTVVNDWAPGTGVRPVQILNLTDSTPFAARFRKKPVMTLRELAQ